MTKFMPWLIWLVLTAVMILPRRWPVRRKLYAFAGAGLLILPYHAMRFAVNTLCWWSPPRFFWLAAQFAYTCAVFLCGLGMLDWLLFPVMKRFPRVRRRTGGLRYRFLLAAVLSALGIGWSLCPPRVRAYEVELKNASGRAGGTLRIAAVSDLHFDPVYDHGYAARIVRKLNALKPDVILLLGDFSNTLNGLSPEVLAELKKLSAPEGVYAVTGNHEYYPEGQQNFQRLNRIGIAFLCNESAGVKQGQFFLAGINDPRAEHEYPAGPDRFERTPLVRKAVKNVPPGKPLILLAHQPKFLPFAAENHVDLQLSGHLHGGLFPGLNLGFSLIGAAPHGLYSEGHTRMIVSSGTGIWCGFPVRFCIPPEIVLVNVSVR